MDYQLTESGIEAQIRHNNGEGPTQAQMRAGEEIAARLSALRNAAVDAQNAALAAAHPEPKAVPCRRCGWHTKNSDGLCHSSECGK